MAGSMDDVRMLNLVRTSSALCVRCTAADARAGHAVPARARVHGDAGDTDSRDKARDEHRGGWGSAVQHIG
jgi:hypothetical protein